MTEFSEGVADVRIKPNVGFRAEVSAGTEARWSRQVVGDVESVQCGECALPEVAAAT